MLTGCAKQDYGIAYLKMHNAYKRKKKILNNDTIDCSEEKKVHYMEDCMQIIDRKTTLPVNMRK